MGQRAVYRDEHGHTYSAPIVFQDGQWLMRTSEGLAAITLQFDDDQGGRLEFVGQSPSGPSLASLGLVLTG